ncbi:phosphatase PAP2 family protein [Antarcticibacterium flavum]|uniref:Phosphatase PAP2 family protein n=1 Tax=Antarcticibacterium flavum TaxID=2058175 RepID=A0A5B7WZH4_9FLAO|nr:MULTISPECIES: phosphatase PAP2 family protein [Antarcticibacterium]MCM4158744.1 PA-phosphatase [Antarcticibacterium sp. W02-3]QCY68596.1 phosphatase PAP2 family protein [Antarcticibacterium flavum]
MKLKSLLLLFLILLINLNAYSQKKESPYETDLLKDGIWITTGVGLNVIGFLLIQNKDALTEAELNNLSKDDIWKIDRWAAGNSSEKANQDSYIPMFGSIGLPLLLMLSENERSHAGQLSVLFVESMATTGALFTITAGLVQKSRPLVYDTNLPIEDRIGNDEQRSFFAGHTAATASATFFAAKVFHDFNPNSPLRPYVWGVAAAIPATVGYLRIRSGKHFLTDNIIGFAVGAASGILIPEIHKKKNKNLQLYPAMGFNHGGMNITSQGVGLSYKF